MLSRPCLPLFIASKKGVPSESSKTPGDGFSMMNEKRDGLLSSQNDLYPLGRSSASTKKTMLRKGAACPEFCRLIMYCQLHTYAYFWLKDVPTCKNCIMATSLKVHNRPPHNLDAQNIFWSLLCSTVNAESGDLSGINALLRQSQARVKST